MVIPARNEAANIGGLVSALSLQLSSGDQLMVVDDRSTDDTAAIARSAGAEVFRAPSLPAGWVGKPHACHTGVTRTSAPMLVFVDADVTPAADLLDRLAVIVDRDPDGLVSVQPHHVAVKAAEQLSLVGNIVALMGAAAFTAFGDRPAPRMAFGPVLACRRTAYLAAGGHAHPDVRAQLTEDLALARRFDHRQLFTGRPDTTFRMYPDGGLGDVIAGWTRNIASGAGATPAWASVLVFAWVWSLCGGWVASPWFAAASMVQLAVLGRRAGRFAWWMVVAYPVAAAFFVAVVIRSTIARGGRRSVTWKGRRVTGR